ncbi:MAG: helix-turn-helix transcriptional regulator [Flavobacteriales bacterium]
MPANKYALLRYRVIDRCLKNKGRKFPTREDLRQACEEALYGVGSDAISLSTIDKDIWAMKNEGELGYYAPILYDRAEKGYCYEDENYSISELSLNDDDLQAIRFAAATLDQFRDMPILRQYENAIEKIINRVNISPNPDDASLDKFIQFEKSTVSKGNEHLGPLLEAIQTRKTIRISYRKFTDDSVKEYELNPYLLKEYHNRWYLVALEITSNSIRTFGLERIESLETAERRFTRDKSFDADVFFKHSIGITEKQDKPQEVVLSFAPVIGKFLLTQPIHPSQRLISESKKEIRLALHVLLTQELYSFILSYGPQAKVVQPALLKKQIKAMVEEMWKGYE